MLGVLDQRLLVQHVGTVQCGQDFFTDVFYLGRRVCSRHIQIFEHHDELVAPQAGHRVGFTHTFTQTFGHLLQQKVANVVPQRVVDGLEMVQIHE